MDWQGRQCNLVVRGASRTRTGEHQPAYAVAFTLCWHALLFVYRVIGGREWNWKRGGETSRPRQGWMEVQNNGKLGCAAAFAPECQHVKVTYGLEHTILVHVSFALGYDSTGIRVA